MSRQDTDGKAIFVFRHADTKDWAIERIGFSWKNQQTSPPNWQEFMPPEQPPTGYDDPWAVGILFSGPASGGDSGYFNGYIADCVFRNGWRGIAMDDTYTAGVLSVWNVQMERLNFWDMAGAGISLVPAAFLQGDPSNSIRNIYVDQPTQENFEAQVRLYGQGCTTLVNIDLERSKTRVMQINDCTNLDITNLYIEHVRVTQAYYRMITIYGGRVRIQGLNVDGAVDAEDEESSIIGGGPGAEITISGVFIPPHDPTDPDPDTGGFIPLNGSAALIAGDAATYTLLDRPRLPVYPESQRLNWAGNQFPNQLGTYDALYTYRDEFDLPQKATIPDIKLRMEVALPGIAAHGMAEFVREEIGVRPGDVVRLGPPADLPASVFAMGLVTAPNLVTIRLFNAAASSITAAETLSTWTVFVGNGPDAGDPQPL